MTMEEVADVILARTMGAVGAAGGVLALVRGSAGKPQELEVMRIKGFPADSARVQQRFPVAQGKPLSDSVLTNSLVYVADFSHHLRSDVADQPYSAFIAVPVAGSSGVIAVLGFMFPDQQNLDQDERVFLSTIGELCAQSLERARLASAVSAQLSRAAFLARSGEALASSLDYQATLGNVARSAVPELGDWCAVDIVVNPAAQAWPPVLRRLAVVHEDPQILGIALSLEERFPTDWSQEAGMPQVIRSGVSQFFQRSQTISWSHPLDPGSTWISSAPCVCAPSLSSH